MFTRILAALLLAIGLGAVAYSQGFTFNGLPNGTSTNPTISGQNAGTGIFFTDQSVAITRKLSTSNRSGNVPALSSCGTGAALSTGSNDVAGTVTTGSGATTCTITFGTAYAIAPSCVVQTQGAATQPTYTVSATAITATVSIASTAYNYICIGKAGG